MPRSENSHSADLLRAYLAARYMVFTAQGKREWRVGAIADLDRIARGTPFALLAAWNPRSVSMTQAANEASQRRLLDLLDMSGVPRFDAENSAADGSHREPSVLAIGVSIERCDELAHHFGQNAALAGNVGAPVRLRVYADWRGSAAATGVDTTFVDWVAPDSLA